MDETPVRRTRLRFDELDLESFQDGRCRLRIRLVGPDGETFSGEASGTETLVGSLRTAAQATLQAAEAATGGRLTLSLVGIKAVRAFDSWVIIGAVRAESEQRTYGLLGAETAADGDTVTAAVRTILDATNRVLEKYVEGLQARTD